MGELLDRALADLIEHPDSSAREIGARLGVNSRTVYAVLHNAAYEGRCQSWLPAHGSAWLWQVPGHEGERYRKAVAEEADTSE